MKIVLFSLIVILAALNIFCSVLYSKLLNRLPGQLAGRITLSKLNAALGSAISQEDKNLIKRCKYVYTIYLVIFYLFIIGVLIPIFSVLKR